MLTAIPRYAPWAVIITLDCGHHVILTSALPDWWRQAAADVGIHCLGCCAVRSLRYVVEKPWT